MKTVSYSLMLVGLVIAGIALLIYNGLETGTMHGSYMFANNVFLVGGFGAVLLAIGFALYLFAPLPGPEDS